MKEAPKASPIRWQVGVVAFGGLALSLLLLIVAQNLNPKEVQPPWLIALLQNVGSTLMVATTVGLLVEWMTRREMMGLMEDTKKSVGSQIHTLRALEDLGLVDAYSDVNGYSFSQLLLTSKEFTAVMNDGKSWVGRNAGDLRRRMLVPGLTTTFILQHPSSAMLEVLAHKVQQPPDFIRQKIADAVREVHSFEKADDHILTTLGHSYFNVHSLFMTEDYIAYTPYLITPGRNTTPLFVFEKRGKSAQYQRWYDDVQALIKLSKPLIPELLPNEETANDQTQQRESVVH